MRDEAGGGMRTAATSNKQVQAHLEEARTIAVIGTDKIQRQLALRQWRLSVCRV